MKTRKYIKKQLREVVIVALVFWPLIIMSVIFTALYIASH